MNDNNQVGVRRYDAIGVRLPTGSIAEFDVLWKTRDEYQNKFLQPIHLRISRASQYDLSLQIEKGLGSHLKSELEGMLPEYGFEHSLDPNDNGWEASYLLGEIISKGDNI